LFGGHLSAKGKRKVTHELSAKILFDKGLISGSRQTIAHQPEHLFRDHHAILFIQ